MPNDYVIDPHLHAAHGERQPRHVQRQEGFRGLTPSGIERLIPDRISVADQDRRVVLDNRVVAQHYRERRCRHSHAGY